MNYSIKKFKSSSSFLTTKHFHDEPINGKFKSSLSTEYSLNDISFLGAECDLYDIKLINSFIDDERVAISAFDSNYSYYSYTKSLFEFEPIHFLSNSKTTKNQSNKMITRPKLKLPSINQTKTQIINAKQNLLFDKYQSQKKNVKDNSNQTSQQDLIKNILNYDIYDGKKSIKYEDIKTNLANQLKPNKLLLFESTSTSSTPVCQTPRTTPVFDNNENSCIAYESNANFKCDDELLPNISFRDRYPIYFNLTPDNYNNKDDTFKKEQSTRNLNHINRTPIKSKYKK